METKRMLLVSTESGTETAMLMDILRQNGIPALAQGKQAGEALEAYMGFSPYGDDIYVDKDDLSAALDVIGGMEQEK